MLAPLLTERIVFACKGWNLVKSAAMDENAKAMDENAKPDTEVRTAWRTLGYYYINNHGWLFAGVAFLLISWKLFVPETSIALEADNQKANEFRILGGFVFAGFAIASLAFCFSSIRNYGLKVAEPIMKKIFPDEKERSMAMGLIYDFAPILSFILCVYTVFWGIGYFEEIITVGILASFAWFAKMEKHYGGRFKILGAVIDEGSATEDSFVCSIHPFLCLRAPLKNPHSKAHIDRRDDPTINIGIASRTFAPIYFCLWTYNISVTNHASVRYGIYTFWQIPYLFEDIRNIAQIEGKTIGADLHTLCMMFDDSFLDNKGRREIPISGSIRMPYGVHPNYFHIIVTLYFWFLIRYRNKYIGGIVGYIGWCMGKILYMFFKSDVHARDTIHY